MAVTLHDALIEQAQPLGVLQHGIEGGTSDLRELAELGLAHAGREGFGCEGGDGFTLGEGLGAGLSAGGPVALDGGPKFVHESSVYHLTTRGNGRIVLYMENTQQPTSQTATYELCYDPREADMLIYRSIPAGVCGPFSESIPCTSREDAERIAFNMGYLIAGEWQSHTTFDSADLTRMA